MNKLIPTVLCLALPLAGCGSGSSSSSSSATTYTWQIVNLQSADETSLGDSCIIYADSDANSDEVITAYTADEDYNILYHNSDGSIASTFESSDFTDGKITITKSDVPDDGYVTLEEVDGSIDSSADVYMFSVEKSLLTDLVVNVRQDDDGSCLVGDDYRDTTINFEDAALSVDTDGLSYYLTSYDEDSVNGGISILSIPVESPETPEHDTLVTAFNSYGDLTDQKTELKYYAFADPDYIYDSSDITSISIVELSNADLYDLSWNADSASGSTLTLDESSIYALHDDVLYYWQPLYSGLDLTMADTSDVSSWTGYFNGSESANSWLFEAFVSFDRDGDSDTNSEVSFTLPTLDAITATTLETNCAVDDSTADYCLDTANIYSTDDYDLQRTNLRMTATVVTSSTYYNDVYQSIYASASNSPVVLENTQFTNDADTSVTLAIDNLELNLMSSDADDEDAVKYLMAQSMDEVSIADSSNSIATYYDANGSVTDNDERDELTQAMFNSTSSVVKNNL